MLPITTSFSAALANKTVSLLQPLETPALQPYALKFSCLAPLWLNVYSQSLQVAFLSPNILTYWSIVDLFEQLPLKPL